jgi:1-acyl-sn-glycerol-3-phosphate acyltransferase
VKPASRWVGPLIRGILRTMCRYDPSPLSEVPRQGPLILAINHVNFVDGPLLLAYLYPRQIVSVAKQETWVNPLLGALATMVEAIPIDREATDLGAMRSSLRALEEGKILLISPEGTRSKHGRLQRGRPGIVAIALRSGAPILPIAVWGAENVWKALLHGRRAALGVGVGPAFRLKSPPKGEPKSSRAAMADEIMGRIAALLPERYRGVYGAAAAKEPVHLDFSSCDP